ncbi:ABC transporter permease subunit [Dankookia sp. P2]|uniref:ABC transporter permease subunit n=1 Tax=Dankookia sp. P2 TaxID=3423955 RepID=UPI003D67E6E7
MSDTRLMVRHILPNAMVATLTFLPFILSGSVTVLASLDFLGFGLPPGAPSLGELLGQGKNNLQAPWLAFTGFVVLGGLLTLLIFVGEAVRDAFDPRKLPGAGDDGTEDWGEGILPVGRMRPTPHLFLRVVTRHAANTNPQK